MNVHILLLTHYLTFTLVPRTPSPTNITFNSRSYSENTSERAYTPISCILLVVRSVLLYLVGSWTRGFACSDPKIRFRFRWFVSNVVSLSNPRSVLDFRFCNPCQILVFESCSFDLFSFFFSSVEFWILFEDLIANLFYILIPIMLIIIFIIMVIRK